MMLQIFFNYLFCDVPATPSGKTDGPKVAAPIALPKNRKLCIGNTKNKSLDGILKDSKILKKLSNLDMRQNDN